jgi:hypothetical protein
MNGVRHNMVYLRMVVVFRFVPCRIRRPIGTKSVSVNVVKAENSHRIATSGTKSGAGDNERKLN